MYKLFQLAANFIVRKLARHQTEYVFLHRVRVDKDQGIVRWTFKDGTIATFTESVAK